MKPDWLDLLIFSLALWRLAHMVVFERGFFDIFLNFRRMLGIVHDDDGEPMGAVDNNWARLFNCVWCTSMFFAIPYAVLIYLFQDVMRWLSLPFALSAAAVWFNSRMR